MRAGIIKRGDNAARIPLRYSSRDRTEKRRRQARRTRKRKRKRPPPWRQEEEEEILGRPTRRTTREQRRARSSISRCDARFPAASYAMLRRGTVPTDDVTAKTALRRQVHARRDARSRSGRKNHLTARSGTFIASKRARGVEPWSTRNTARFPAAGHRYLVLPTVKL